MYDEHTGFLHWASCYETGELEGRSLPMERKFLKSNSTRLFEIERELPLEALTKLITAFLSRK